MDRFELEERKQMQRVQYPDIPQQLEQEPMDQLELYQPDTGDELTNRQKLRRTFQSVR